MKASKFVLAVSSLFLLASCNQGGNESSNVNSSDSSQASSQAGSSASSESSVTVLSAKQSSVTGNAGERFNFTDLFNYEGEIEVTEDDPDDILLVNPTTRRVILNKAGKAAVIATQGNATARVEITVNESEDSAETLKELYKEVKNGYYAEGVDMSSGSAVSTHLVRKAAYDFDTSKGTGIGIFPSGKVYRFRQNSDGFYGYGSAKDKAEWEKDRFLDFDVTEGDFAVSSNPLTGDLYLLSAKNSSTGKSNELFVNTINQFLPDTAGNYADIVISLTHTAGILTGASIGFYAEGNLEKDVYTALIELTFAPTSEDIVALESFLKTASDPEQEEADKDALTNLITQYHNGTGYRIYGADYLDADGDIFEMDFSKTMFYNKDWFDDDQLGSGYINEDGKVYRYEEYKKEEELESASKGTAIKGSEVAGWTDYLDHMETLFSVDPNLFSAAKPDADDPTLFVYGAESDNHALAEEIMREIGYDPEPTKEGQERSTNFGDSVSTIYFEVSDTTIYVSAYLDGKEPGQPSGKVLFQYDRLNSPSLPLYVPASEHEADKFVGTYKGTNNGETYTLTLDGEGSGTLDAEAEGKTSLHIALTYTTSGDIETATKTNFSFTFGEGKTDTTSVGEVYAYSWQWKENKKIINAVNLNVGGDFTKGWVQFKIVE